MSHVAIDFLQILDPRPDATFNIEHYTDLSMGEEKPKPDPLAGRYPNLTITAVQTLIPKLHSINNSGAGIFVARNQCSGQRSKDTVTRVRGVHADMDGVGASELAAVTVLLQPSIIVQSSTQDRNQLYWQLSEGEFLSHDETEGINRRLVTSHSADKAAVDVSRLLRLPGFKHMKYSSKGETPTVTLISDGPTYTAEEIRNAFPPIEAKAKPKKPAPPSNIGGTVKKFETPIQFEEVETTVAEKYQSLWTGDWNNAIQSSGEVGYPSQSEADLALAGHIGRAALRMGINVEEIPEVVLTVFGRSTLGQSDKWQQREDYRNRTVQKVVDSFNTLEFQNASNGLQLESHGDIRNAKAFSQTARGIFIYVTTRDRWLKWSDERWQLCEKEEHIAEAKKVCGQILSAAGTVFSQHQERGKKLIQEAMSAHTLPRIMAMIKLAVSEPEMSVTDKELDSDPYLLGVRNGLVYLRTVHHQPNHPKTLVTRYCNAAYEEDATCPRWTVFLDQIFQGDIETIECVQRLLGCTLLGLNTEEILIICYGHGSNGKSVFSNVVHKILGGYAITAPPSLLTARRKDDTGPRNDLAALAGARYVSINETQAGDRLDEQVVKILAGREPISARFLNQEFFEFDPTFTPWLRTNHKPVITGEDDGIWRRLVLLRFGRKFTDDEKDPYLEEKLLDESNGILMWMLEGARLYLESGIRQSPRMLAERATYRKESDLLGEFLDDNTTPDPNAKVNQATLYQAYREWTQMSGVRALSKKSFTQRLAERGHPEGKSGNARFYVGLRLGQAETALPLLTQGGVDGIGGISGNSLQENLTLDKTPNSPTSCPTRPSY
jgi:putative DNA primase/helicase